MKLGIFLDDTYKVVDLVDDGDTVVISVEGQVFIFESPTLDSEEIDSPIQLSEDVFEQIENYLLANPFHDKMGRFASSFGSAAKAQGRAYGQAGKAYKEGVKNFGGLSGSEKAMIVGMTASLAAIPLRIGGYVLQSKVDKKVKAGLKEQGIEFGWKDFGNVEKAKEYEEKYAKELENIKNEKVFSTSVGGKEFSINYGQIRRAGKAVSLVGTAASLIGMGLLYGGMYSQKQKSDEDLIRDAQKRGEWSHAQREKRLGKKEGKPLWPPTASEEKFTRMYRELSKKYHPDLGGDADVQQRINEAYAKKDWWAMSKLYKKPPKMAYRPSPPGRVSGLIPARLEAADGNPTEEEMAVIGLIIRILKESLADGSDYLVVPAYGETEIDPFVIEDDELILDRPTMEMIVEAYDDNSGKQI